MKKEKGITLLALVVTIVILLLLAGVTLNTILDENGLITEIKKSVEKSKEISKQEEEKSKLLEEGLQDINKETFNNKGVNRPALRDGMIPIKYKDGNWVITNEYDDEWYEYKDVSNLAWANVMLSDGKYKWNQRNNKGAEGYYTDDGTTIVEEKDLGSMFVWIPRYAYSFNSYHTEMNKAEGTTQNITNIVFLSGISNRDFEGNTYETTYSLEEMDKKVGQPTPMIVHPGFTFDNKQLTGIWVAKFEASMSGNNLNNKTYNDKETMNTSSDDNCVKILPNAETWRYISVGNCFWNSYNMMSSGNIYKLKSSQVDTHLMKSTEWGIVAYISASQYGVVPKINDKLEKTEKEGAVIYHSFAGGKDYKSNGNQSTTGNITGIYDMNGGSIEHVAAYFDNLDSNLYISGGEKLFGDRVLNKNYEKYWNKYEVSDEEKNVTQKNGTYRNFDLVNSDGSEASNKKRKDVTDKRYNLLKNKLGDALYETIKTYSFMGRLRNGTWSWLLEYTDTEGGIGVSYYNGDASGIGNGNGNFLGYGGYYTDGNYGGIFSPNGEGGQTEEFRGFRPVIVI